MAKTVSGTTTQYLVDDLNPTGLPQVVEELTNGAVTRTYTYGLQRVNERTGVLNEVSGRQASMGMTDYGSVRMLTDHRSGYGHV